MSIVSVSEAQARLRELLTAAESEPVFIERRGQHAAVLVSPERYEQMLSAIEEVEDAAAFDAALAEEGQNILWAQVKADLGWA